jgi:hypothetical protein
MVDEINSYGVHERHTYVESGLISRDKSTYTNQEKKTKYLKNKKKTAAQEKKYITQLQNLTNNTQQTATKNNTVKIAESVGTVATGVVTTGTSFLAECQSYQNNNDDIGNKTVNNINRSFTGVQNGFEKLSSGKSNTVLKSIKSTDVKANKSRFFKEKSKTSESVNSISHASRLASGAY